MGMDPADNYQSQKRVIIRDEMLSVEEFMHEERLLL